MKIKRILLVFLFLGSFYGYGQQVFTLLSNLEYPRALCLDNGKVYFTETQGALDPFGGRVSLLQYDISSAQTDTLVHQLICSNTILVHPSGALYLGSEIGPSAGDQGWVSQYVPGGNDDTIVTTVDIATHDMRLNSAGDVLLIGQSFSSNAKSIQRFDGGDFTNPPTILKTGKGIATSIVQHDSIVYYATNQGIYFFGPDGIEDILSGQPSVAIDYYKGYIYYANIQTGTIGRVSIASGSNTILVSGLNQPVNLRIDTANGSLYFLESGTSAGQFFDGTLKVLDISYLHIGVDEVSSVPSLSIYPNPVSDGVLTIANAPKDSEITITDIQGREVHHTRSAESGVIDVSTLNEGIYILRIHTREGQSIQRMVVQ
ncbi:MAG: T9SS type A sorting domain-containing protein [Owenweeksia sp.]